MLEAIRLFLLIALTAALMTTAALIFAWWMEPERRLRRALVKCLGGPAGTDALAPADGTAAGMDFGQGLVVVLWNRGADGLIYRFDEIQGGEIIVDGHVVARVRRREARKELDVMAPDAEQVVLRLMFDDPRHPEFELALWNAVRPGRNGSPAEALRLGRRWLSHIEALMKA